MLSSSFEQRQEEVFRTSQCFEQASSSAMSCISEESLNSHNELSNISKKSRYIDNSSNPSVSSRTVTSYEISTPAEELSPDDNSATETLSSYEINSQTGVIFPDFNNCSNDNESIRIASLCATSVSGTVSSYEVDCQNIFDCNNTTSSVSSETISSYEINSQNLETIQALSGNDFSSALDETADMFTICMSLGK